MIDWTLVNLWIKKYKLVVSAILSFVIFVVTMFYVNVMQWLMLVSLISFVSYLLSIFYLILNVRSELDSK